MKFKSTILKKTRWLLGLVMVSATMTTHLQAQVSVTATSGTMGPTTYTALNAAFAAINAGTHQGVITIAITGNTSEPATPTPLLASAGTSSYTAISIKPSGGSFTISSTAPVTNRGIIELAGADNVTIDGDDPATPGTQNLSVVSATATTAGIACIRLSSNSTTGTDGANNVTVKNCIIVGSRNSATSTTTSYGIQFSNGTSTSSSSTGAYSSLNTVIQNNTITRCYYGINAIGNSTTYLNTGLQVIGNTVGSATASEYVAYTALNLSYTSSSAGAGSALVSRNDFRTGFTAGTTNMGAIMIGAANAGAVITRNYIHDCLNPSSGVWGMYGIYINSGTSNAAININNNIIRDITGYAVSSLGNQYGGSGVYISGAATGILFNHNTIAQLTSSAIGSCILMGSSTATFAQFQNNILVNDVASPYSCLFYTAGTGNISGATADYNDYYINASGVFGYYSGNIANFAAWKTATSKDANSKNVLPGFVSATDLHITPAQVSFLESAGAPTASTSVTVDFDNDARPGPAGSVNGGGTAPDIGADEFDGILPPSPPVINSVAASPGTQCTAVAHSITANITPGGTPLTSVVLTYAFNGVTQPTIALTGGNVSAASNWTGTIPVGSPANATVTWFVTVTDGIYTKITNGTSYGDDPASLFVATASVSPATICAGNTASLSLNLTSTSTTTYCVPAAATSSSSYFDSFTTTGGVSNITNSASGASANGYGNFTSLIASQKAGQAVNFNTVLAGTTVGVAIWVDWNHNGVFEASETVYNTTSYVSTATGSFTVPVTAGLGATRMRIFMDFNNSNPSSTPCGPYGSGRGETEDYTFVVLPASLTYTWSNGVTTFTSTTNPSTVTVNAASTFTGTALISGCPIAASVQTTVTPLPSAPTVTNSTQCGNGIPTAMVGGGAAYNWYASPTSTTVLQSGASQTYTNSISVTTTFYVSSVVGLCESPRTSVMASVTQPDAVNAVASSTTICPAGSVTLTAVQTGTNNLYTFSWVATPVAGSGLSSSVPGQSISVSPTAPGTYAYKVTATDGVCTTTAVVNVTMNVPPVITAAATPTVLCSGSTASLNATTPVIAAGTKTVGAGGSTSNTGGSPFYHGWGGAKVQYIYTAAELTAAGFSAGNITALGLNITAVGIPYEGFAINVGTTTQSAFASANTIGGLTQVFLGTGTNNSYLPTVGLNTFNFSTPIFWNGTDNIVVSICWSNATTGGTSSTVKWDTYSSNVGMYIYSDSQTPSTVCGATTTIPASGGSSTTTGRPQTVFSGQVQSQGAGPLTWQWNPGAINTNTANVNPVNTGTSAVTQVYTVTATNTITTCSNTATVSILVNPLPSTPVASNSSQCGLGIPTASVSGGTSYKWYATPTSTTVLQSGASANYTTAINATTTWYVSSFNGTCESVRAMLTTSVTIPDLVTAASTSSAVCPGSTFTLTATKSGTVNTYAYTWTASPAAGSGIPTSASGATTAVSPTAAGTYNYLVTAVDGVCTTTAAVNVTLNPPPNISNAMATPTAVCSAGSVSLSAVSINALPGNATIGTNSLTDYLGGPYRQGAGTDNKVQWLFTAAELTAAGITQGNITSISFNVPTGSADVMPNFTVRMGATATTSITTTYDAAPPVVFGPASVSAATGVNTYTFATPFYWNGTSNVIVQVCHDVVVGGGGSTPITRQATTNTTAYTNSTGACASTSGTSVSYRPVVTFSAQVGTNVTSSIGFVWNPGSIPTNTAVVNPVNTGTNAVTQVYTVTATNTVTGCSNTATTSVVVNPVPVNPTAVNSIQCGLGVPTASVSGGTAYKWYATPTSTTVLQSGASANYTTAINATTTWYVSSYNANCESGRTAVTATVTTPDAVSAVSTSTGVCPGQSFTLTAVHTGTNNVYSYTWTATPAAGSGIATSVTGATTAVTPSTPGSRSYVVTAADAICTTTAAVTVVAIAPPAIVASSTPSVICSGSTATLNAVTPAIGSGSLAIGNGTGLTTTTEELTAFCNRRIDYRQQTLYTAAELSAAGLFAGNITAISYSITTIGDAPTNNNFTVKCGTVAATTFTDYVVSTGFTTVLPPMTYTHNTGLNTITFSTPYFWDGVSNLVVEVSHDGIDALYNAQTYYETLTSNRTVYGYNSATVGTLSTKRFNTIFNGQVGTQSAGGLNWQWNPGAVNSNTMVVSPTTTGSPITPSYTVTAIDPATTCSNTAVVTITVNPVPSVSVAASTGSICSGTTASLTASGASTYSWMPAGGSATVAVVSPTASTVYTVTGTSLGCSNTQTVNLNVTATPTVVASASPSVICAGSTVSLTATGATTYSWMPNSSASASTTASPAVSTTYTVSGTTSGCTNTKTLTVTVNDVPTLTVTGTPSALCTTGATATLTATGTSTAYVWSSGATTASTTVSPSATTVYTVTGTNSCGVKTGTTSIAVATTPTIAAMSSSTLICANNTAVLTASATPGVTYSWNTGAGTMSISVSPSVTTTYTVTGANACGTATATVVQNVSPCTSIEEITGSGEISIYPNPASDYVSIAVPANVASGTTHVEITDALGKVVMHETINTDVTTLKISQLEEGVYFFRVISNSQTLKVGKVVKH